MLGDAEDVVSKGIPWHRRSREADEARQGCEGEVWHALTLPV